MQEVSRFDKRIITQLYRQEPFLTREQEQLNVDFYVKWRINNLRRYYEATGGTEEVANDRLGETIKDSIKSVVTQRTLQQVVTAERARIHRCDDEERARPPPSSWASIWSMCASPRSICRSRFRTRYSSACARRFKAQAAKLRAEGVESSERTRADANKQQTEILADAARQAGADSRPGRCVGQRGVCQVVLEECGVLQLLPQHAVLSGGRRHPGRCAGDRAGQRLLQVLQQAAAAASVALMNTMEIGWTELARYLGGAFALYLVLEGILPFVNPAAAQRLMAKLAKTEPAQLRWGGLISMVAGLASAVGGAQWVRTWS